MAAKMTPTSDDANTSVFLLDHAHWPTVDASAIANDADRDRYQRLRRGIDLLRGGQPQGVAAKAARLGRKSFRRLVRKCLTLADDGQLAGYRACVWGWRAHEAQRNAAFKPGKTMTAGFSGLFGKLLRDRPEVEAALVERLRRRGQAGIQVNHITGRKLRLLLEQVCRESGLTDAEYPLNTQDKGLRALRRWITRKFLPKHAREWTKHEHGATAAAILSDRATEIPEVTDPNDDWIIDEVKVDMRARYELVGMFGDVDSIELERFIELRVIHGGTGAVIANHLVLAAQASAADLGKLLYKATCGSPRLELTVPGLHYEPGAGYPADSVEGMRFRAPRFVYLDNALAHLAKDAQYIVQATLGAEVRMGRPAYPIARGPVEASFANEARRVTHELPGTTGSGPSEENRVHRKLPVTQLIRADELAQVLDVYHCNTNAAPHTASNGIAPLERLRRLLAAGRLHGVLIPVENRRPHMFAAPVKVHVRAELPRGRKPFVIYKKVRYSSQLLQQRFDLIGHTLWLRVDQDDLRVVLLFHPDGTELGAVRAVGRWGMQPHDLRMRNMCNKLINDAQFARMPQDGPVGALLAHLNAGAPRDRKVALRLAYVMEYLKRHVSAEMVVPGNAEFFDESVENEARNADAAASGGGATGAAPSTPVDSASAKVVMVPRRAVRR